MGQRTIIEVCHGRYQIQVQERIESTPVVLKEERAASRTKGGGMMWDGETVGWDTPAGERGAGGESSGGATGGKAHGGVC